VPATGAANAPEAPSVSGSDDWILTGDQARWPDYIPDEIPPLDGAIRQIMQGSTSLRVFYSDLSQQQIDAWLALLRQRGFEVQYVVYVQEGFPDDSAERIAAGDFDAVNISKDRYHLDISYGGGATTLDMQTSGFEDAYPFTPDRDWPADLAGVIPPPTRSRIEAVYAQSDGGYQVVATPSDGTAVADYVQTLLAAGFAPLSAPAKGSAPVAGDYLDVYGRDDIELTIDHSPSISTMRLTVWRVDRANLPTWPADLDGLVPQPDGSSVKMLVPLGGHNWIISCAGPGAQLLAAYADQLSAAGFTVTDRSESPGAGWAQVELQGRGLEVDLSLGATGELMVRVSDGS
jgi:hypothetical protein